ncbi:MAG: PEP-CTERM sorting domain-containing protein [Steroidobacteraceae bacterium]
MLRQKKHRRALWAAAFAAAPIGAHAGPVAPNFSCNAQGELSTIQWGQDPVLTGNGSVIAVTESGGEFTKGTNGGSTGYDLTQTKGSTGGSTGYDLTQTKGTGAAQTQSVPFMCGFDLTKIKGDSAAVTPGANIFASATLNSGSAFAIDFGTFTGRGMAYTKEAVDFTPVFTAASYTLSGYGPIQTKGGVSSPSVVTDFNLYLDATNAATHQPLYQDYLGVQVISGSSVLGSADQFFVSGLGDYKTSQLLFDPAFSGTATVNLLTSPDPALTGASSSVPEPGTLALLGAGFIGLLAALRRRKRPEDGESEA